MTLRLKHVLRRLASSPMFTAVTLATLAIGMGANTAIFSVIEGILLKPLPYPSPEELISVDHIARGVTKGDLGMAPFLYFTYREQGRTLQDIAIWQSHDVTVTGLAEPERVNAIDVTDGMLPLLGVRPVAGRMFSRQDATDGSPDTVMVTYGYWQRKFGGDLSVVGKRVLVNDGPREIIGVLPAGFWFLDRKLALLMPLRFTRNRIFLGQFSFQAIARLRSGTSIAEANADMARLIPPALHNFPPFPGYDVKMFEQARITPVLQPLKQAVAGEIGKVLWVVMGTIGMVLLIACANVANLLLVRAEGRQQELAIRAALGAGWSEIVRELLAESVTLGVLGGVWGLGLAYGGLRVLVAIAPANLPRLEQISLDGPVLLFNLAVSLASGVLFGLIPALKYAGPHLGNALRAGGRTLSQSKERHRLRNSLVVVQVALALVLLIASGLMIRTFYALKQVQPGFTRPADIQTLRLSIPTAQAREAQVTHMQQEIMEKFAALPGVSSVAMTSLVPMDGSGWKDPIYASDKKYTDSKIPPVRHFKFVSPGLLATMGNSLVAGRDFTWTDVYDLRPVAMVSENLARELWGDPQAAVGKRIRESLKGQWREVIGVAGDERDDGLHQAAPPIVLWPVLMSNFANDKVFAASREVAFVIRSSRAGSKSLIEDVSKAVWSVNPRLPLAQVRTLQEVADKSLARTAFTLVMLGIAGAMALLLSVVGIYGVISYSVSQRTREIGIRIALGADVPMLTRMFVLHGLRLAGIGVACGLAGAMGLSRLMSGLLFEVHSTDPLTYAAVSVGLAAAAVLASYVPASRAAKVDPVEALRAE